MAAVTADADALGEVSLLIECEGRLASGQSALDGHPGSVGAGLSEGDFQRAVGHRHGRRRAARRATVRPVSP